MNICWTLEKYDIMSFNYGNPSCKSRACQCTDVSDHLYGYRERQFDVPRKLSCTGEEVSIDKQVVCEECPRWLKMTEVAWLEDRGGCVLIPRGIHIGHFKHHGWYIFFHIGVKYV